MSHFTRPGAYTRPDSRASQISGYNDGLGGGRFTNALSAAIKRDDGVWPGQQAGAANVPAVSSPEEQLEEIEQKVTLALQAIDANFDLCQRTMARSVMPKVERLAQLSSELLTASQPWLQFFMAVASADDEQGLMSSVMTLDNGDSRPAGLAQQRVVEEMPRGGEITARFPPSSKEEEWDVEEEEEEDIDADIATPQLTSRFMTQELGTPVVIGRKRLAEQLGSASAKKRRVGGGTPMKTNGASAATAAAPRTPVSLMHALVSGKERRGVPGSAASFVSKGSSLDTEALMPDTSPPHTTTFTLPTSRRSRVAPAIQQKAAPEDEDDDDDELMDQVNVMLSRYRSPASDARDAMSVGSVASVRSVGSAASAMSVSSLGSAGKEGRALAAKYASPEEVRVQGLRADMEEMLDEIEAAQQQDSEPPADEAGAPPADAAGLDDDLDDDIPSPPQIASNLERSNVVVPEPRQAASDEPPAPANAAAAAAAAAAVNVAAGRAFAENVLRMELEEMDAENMTIGHMSPLANRGRARLVGPDPQRQASGARFHALGSTLDDPFGPTPERPPRTEQPLRHPGSEQHHVTREYAPDSAQSMARSDGGLYSANASSSWDASVIGRRVASALGSDATATFDEHAREGGHGRMLSSDNSLTIDGFTQEVATIDGTTTILPTREMLQRAAAQAAESEASAVLDDRASAGSVGDDPDDSFMFTGELQANAELVQVFDLEAFPPAFRSEPAAGQLRALWEMMRATERIWTLAQVVESARAADEGRMGGLGDSVFKVLLDLLERRRLLRKVSDGLWTAH